VAKDIAGILYDAEWCQCPRTTYEDSQTRTSTAEMPRVWRRHPRTHFLAGTCEQTYLGRSKAVRL